VYIGEHLTEMLVSGMLLIEKGYTLVLREEGSYITRAAVPDVSADEKEALLYRDPEDSVLRFQTGSTPEQQAAFWAKGKSRKKEWDAGLLHRVFNDPASTKLQAIADAHDIKVTNLSTRVTAECDECPVGGAQKLPHRKNAHTTKMGERGQGWSIDTSALLTRPLLNGERCLLAMVEDSVGYLHLALLLNAEMQRQALVARRVFTMSKVQTGNEVKQVRGDGAYRRSKVFTDLIEDIGARPRFAVRDDPNKQGKVEVSQKYIWVAARKFMKRAMLPYVYLGYALKHAGLLHNLSPPPGGKEARMVTMFPYEKDVDWLSLLHVFGCLCHVVLDKKYHGLRKEEDRTLLGAWLGLDIEVSAHIVLVQGEVKRWRDVTHFTEEPGWPTLKKAWKAEGMEVDEASGYIQDDDVDAMFEKHTETVKEESVQPEEEEPNVGGVKEEEGTLRSPAPVEEEEKGAAEGIEVKRGLR